MLASRTSPPMPPLRSSRHPMSAQPVKSDGGVAHVDRCQHAEAHRRFPHRIESPGVLATARPPVVRRRWRGRTRAHHERGRARAARSHPADRSGRPWPPDAVGRRRAARRGGVAPLDAGGRSARDELRASASSRRGSRCSGRCRRDPSTPPVRLQTNRATGAARPGRPLFRHAHQRRASTVGGRPSVFGERAAADHRRCRRRGSRPPTAGRRATGPRGARRDRTRPTPSACRRR